MLNMTTRRLSMKKNVIATFVTLGFLALLISPLAAQDEPAPPRNPRLGPGAGIQKWLELTPEQEAKLKEMSKARMEEAKGFREKLGKMQQDLRQILEDPKADQKKVEGLVDEIHRLKAAQMKAHLKFRKEREAVFTPEQLEKLKKARTRGMEMRRAGRFMRRHPGMRMMMGPGNMRFRGGHRPSDGGFGPGWRWDW
jgi:Spy/CpxP family protein refolding chaperone